jgi:hypothetical protein
MREARLRQAYAPWYGSVLEGIWYSAASVAHLVARQMLKGEPRWELGPRLLGETHFEFRGGTARAGRLRTRLEDRAPGRPLW